MEINNFSPRCSGEYKMVPFPTSRWIIFSSYTQQLFWSIWSNTLPLHCLYVNSFLVCFEASVSLFYSFKKEPYGGNVPTKGHIEKRPRSVRDGVKEVLWSWTPAWLYLRSSFRLASTKVACVNQSFVDAGLSRLLNSVQMVAERLLSQGARASLAVVFACCTKVRPFKYLGKLDTLFIDVLGNKHHVADCQCQRLCE